MFPRIKNYYSLNYTVLEYYTVNCTLQWVCLLLLTDVVQTVASCGRGSLKLTTLLASDHLKDMHLPTSPKSLRDGFNYSAAAVCLTGTCCSRRTVGLHCFIILESSC